MNNVEAFKNNLRNYQYDKEVYKRYCKIYNNVEEAIKLKDEDIACTLLKPFDKALESIMSNIESVFVKMTGFHAISYDKEPSSYNPNLSEQMRLDLIDRYNLLLESRTSQIEIAKKNLLNEIYRYKANIEHVDEVLDKLPKDIKALCTYVYIDGKKIEDVAKSKSIYLSKSGVYWAINNGLEKILNSKPIQ